MIDRSKLLALAGLVASGKTVRDAASTLEIGESTAYRWAKRKGFKRMVERLQDAAVGALLGLLLASHEKATGTLLALLADDKPDSIRLKAASALLETALRGYEVTTLKRRLESVEEALEALEGKVDDE